MVEEIQLKMSSRKVVGVAVASRAMTLVWSTLSRRAISSYDSSARLAVGAESYDSTVLGGAFALGTHWDAAYFSRVSVFGYELEQTHAFFPLVPLVARFLAWVATCVAFDSPGSDILCGPKPPIGDDRQQYTQAWVARSAVAGVLFSNACFCLAALALFKLSCAVLGNRAAAYRAAVLFCFNPASVFMSAFYTEAPFALFSFSGMLVLFGSPSPPTVVSLLLAALCFSLATATRANGVILAGYLGYALLLPFLQGRHLFGVRAVTIAGVKLLVPFILCISPLLAVLAIAHSAFCTAQPIVRREEIPWCSDTAPNIYGYVQKRYWGNGLFAYYEWKQAPNFLLAGPMLVLAVSALATFAGKLRAECVQWHFSEMRALQLPFMLHLMLLLAVAVLFMHIQVVTRFLSACPCLYWHAASLVSAKQADLVVVYFACFFLLGASLFSTFYPWS